MDAYSVNIVMPGYVGPVDPGDETTDPCKAIVIQTIGLVQHKRFNDAIELLEKGVEHNPCSIPLHQVLARLYMDTKQASKGRKAILRLHELGFKDPEFSAMLGAVWYMQRQFGEAILCFREAQAIGASSGEWLIMLAESLRRTGRLEEAESILEDLRGKDFKQRFRLFINLSAIRLQQERFQEAVNFALEALQSKTAKLTALYYLGLASMRMGEVERATAMFERYALRQPDRVAPLRFLERFAREAGNDAQADDYNLKAREILENRRLVRVEKQKRASG
jgi:predicted Zn-dependent protease